MSITQPARTRCRQSTSTDGRRKADLRYEGAPRRREVIRDLVSERGFASARELSDLVGVSEMTVRRDIRTLSEAGKIRQVQGWAAAIPGSDPLDIRMRTSAAASEKRVIGSLAAGLLTADSIVAFDAGTTTLEVARSAPPAMSFSAITHSLPALNVLAQRPAVEVAALGGTLDRRLGMFLPDLDALRSFRVDVLFLGASAIRQGTMYCWTARDAEIKRALIAAADRVVLVCDSSKFVSAKFATFRVGDLANLHTIVTDSALDEGMRSTLSAAGIELFIANPAEGGG